MKLSVGSMNQNTNCTWRQTRAHLPPCWLCYGLSLSAHMLYQLQPKCSSCEKSYEPCMLAEEPRRSLLTFHCQSEWCLKKEPVGIFFIGYQVLQSLTKCRWITTTDIKAEKYSFEISLCGSITSRVWLGTRIWVVILIFPGDLQVTRLNSALVVFHNVVVDKTVAFERHFYWWSSLKGRLGGGNGNGKSEEENS